jgi:plastocyanin
MAQEGHSWGHFAAMMMMLVSSGTSAIARPPAKTHVILVSNLSFGAAPNFVRVGDTIVWLNKDIFRHTATARDKSFDLDLAPGAQAQTVVKKIGILHYYCRFHPGMTGEITAEERSR